MGDEKSYQIDVYQNDVVDWLVLRNELFDQIEIVLPDVEIKNLE